MLAVLALPQALIWRRLFSLPLTLGISPPCRAKLALLSEIAVLASVADVAKPLVLPMAALGANLAKALQLAMFASVAHTRERLTFLGP